MRLATLAFLLLFGITAEARPIGKPWEVVVRLTVQGAKSSSIGSGTVIASQSDRALVLTCAHIFKGSGNNWKHAQIVVDLFDGKLVDQQVRYLESHPGQVVDFNPLLDVGLVAFAPGRELPFAPPVESGWAPQAGEPFVATGCGGGEDAIVWRTAYQQSVRSSQGYKGLECSDRPREGRSGGGLHRDDGRLAGVCDFGAVETATGIYADPSSIHKLLDRNGLTSLYQETATARPQTQAQPQRPFAVPEPIDQPAPAPASRWIPEWFHTDDPLHLGAAVVVVWFVARFFGFRLNLPVTRTAPASIQPVQDDVLGIVASLSERIKRFEERETASKEAQSLFERIRELVKQPPAEAPKA